MAEATTTGSGNETFWIWTVLFMLVLAWIIFGVAAHNFWKRLDKRLYYNELQQARTDTGVGIKGTTSMCLSAGWMDISPDTMRRSA